LLYLEAEVVMKHLAVTLPVVALTDGEVDDVLDHSFPASDPPSWTLGGAEAGPVASQVPTGTVGSRAQAFATAFRPVASLLGAAGVALLVPLFVMLLPLALMYRLVLEMTGWPAWLQVSSADGRRRALTQHVLAGV
jgi:hypothetical protein